jgi:hypothetical protein
MDWNAEVVDQLESHWTDQLRPRLSGLTDAEYFWQPVPACWTLTRRTSTTAPMPLGTGEWTMDYAPPPASAFTTIAWRLCHLIAVFGQPTADRFTVPGPDGHAIDFPGTAASALTQLDEFHDAWIRDVRALGPAGLTRPQGPISPPTYADAPLAKLVMHTHREVIHHGAEISLLRDLYSHREVMFEVTEVPG